MDDSSGTSKPEECEQGAPESEYDYYEVTMNVDNRKKLTTELEGKQNLVRVESLKFDNENQKMGSFRRSILENTKPMSISSRPTSLDLENQGTRVTPFTSQVSFSGSLLDELTPVNSRPDQNPTILSRRDVPDGINPIQLLDMLQMSPSSGNSRIYFTPSKTSPGSFILTTFNPSLTPNNKQKVFRTVSTGSQHLVIHEER